MSWRSRGLAPPLKSFADGGATGGLRGGACSIATALLNPPELLGPRSESGASAAPPTAACIDRPTDPAATALAANVALARALFPSQGGADFSSVPSAGATSNNCGTT